MQGIDSILGVLKDQLKKLSSWQAAIFCAWCAERLFFNYVKFSESTGWGDVSSLRTILDNCWKVIDTGVADREWLAQMVKECEELIPDTEDFPGCSASYALNAGGSIWWCLSCLIDDTNKGGLEASQIAVDDVDFILREIAEQRHLQGDEEESFICNHPLMESEIAAQRLVTYKLLDAGNNRVSLVREISELAIEAKREKEMQLKQLKGPTH